MRPVLFTIPWIGFPIYTYGVMFGLAFLVIWYFSPRLGSRIGNVPRIHSLGILIGIVPFIIGARLFLVWANPDRPWPLTEFLDLRSGGVVAYGGFIACVAVSGIYFRFKKANLWRLADSTAPFLALGLGLVRVGCFFSGCCFGKPTESLVGIRFPAGSVAFKQHAHIGFVGPDASHTVPIHPTQLYESVFTFLLTAFLLWRHFRREKELKGEDTEAQPRLQGDGKDGRIFWILVILYSCWRFFLEFLRDDRLRGTVLTILTQSQFVGLLLIVFALFMIFYWLPRHPYKA